MKTSIAPRKKQKQKQNKTVKFVNLKCTNFHDFMADFQLRCHTFAILNMEHLFILCNICLDEHLTKSSHQRSKGTKTFGERFTVTGYSLKEAISICHFVNKKVSILPVINISIVVVALAKKQTILADFLT